jgi:dihydrofolate synthase/folylpolyglutamate synthase
MLPDLRALVGDRPLTAVVSVLDDKDAAGMLAALASCCERAVFTRSSNPNALPPAVLESLWRQAGGGHAEVVADPVAALAGARAAAGAGGAVLVTGSIYLLADLARARR